MFFKIGKYDKETYQYKYYSSIDAGARPLGVNDGKILFRGTLYDPIAWGVPDGSDLSLKYTYISKVIKDTEELHTSQMVENIILSRIYTTPDYTKEYAPIFMLIKLEAGITYNIATWTEYPAEDRNSILWLYDDVSAFYKYGYPKSPIPRQSPTQLKEADGVTEYVGGYAIPFHRGGDSWFYNGVAGRVHSTLSQFIKDDSIPNLTLFCQAIEITPSTTDVYMIAIGCKNDSVADHNNPANMPGPITLSRARGVLCTPAPLPITGPDINAHHNKIRKGF